MNTILQTDTPGKDRRVLVVDDSAVSRKMLERKLDQLGFNVTAVEDGAKALEHSRNAPPAAVVTDIHMPNLDGFQLCRALRMDPTTSTVVVVVTSANDIEEADRKRAHEVGAAAIVSRTGMLQEVIAALLDAVR